MVELLSRPPRCVSKVSRFPVVSPLARWQASNRKLMTTIRHTTVETTDEAERRLIELLDGTRDLPALARELARTVGRPEREIAEHIGVNVASLARAALLTG